MMATTLAPALLFAAACGDSGGQTSTTSAAATVRPSATAEATATATASASGVSRAQMNKAALEHGKPFVPSEWKPKAGDKIVREIGSSGVFDAYTVSRIAGDKAYLRFFNDKEDGKTPETFSGFVPIPAADSTDMPAEGAYVVVRRSSEESKWQYARVTKVDAEGKKISIETPETDTDDDPMPLEKRDLGPGQFILVK